MNQKKKGARYSAPSQTRIQNNTAFCLAYQRPLFRREVARSVCGSCFDLHVFCVYAERVARTSARSGDR